MIYVIYVVSVLFILLACTMLYVFFRERDFELLVMGATYGASGVLALALPHWWPLAAGFVLVWVLKWPGPKPGDDPEKRDE